MTGIPIKTLYVSNAFIYIYIYNYLFIYFILFIYYSFSVFVATYV